MHPAKVRRDRLDALTDLPNIGPSMAASLWLVGVHRPTDLVGQDEWDLYQRLCHATQQRQDPCVLDTLMSVVRFMAGQEPQPWWHYTDERRHRYGI